MKSNFTFYAFFIMLCVWAQEEPLFSEDFEGDLSGWLIEDVDGDDENWIIASSSDQAEGQGWGPDGTFMAASFGYNLLPGEEAPLDPNNLLITPPIELPADEVLSLKFLLGTNVDYLNDHDFALYIVNDFNGFDESWVPVYEKNFLGIDSAQEIFVDISQFEGQTVQLVFRHYNAKGQFVLLLDDIEIIKESLGVNDIDEVLQFSVYPNPVQDFINIKGNAKIEKTEIYNLNGQQVLSSDNTKINVSQLPYGVYVLKIKTKEGIISRKIIKK